MLSHTTHTIHSSYQPINSPNSTTNPTKNNSPARNIPATGTHASQHIPTPRTAITTKITVTTWSHAPTYDFERSEHLRLRTESGRGKLFDQPGCGHQSSSHLVGVGTPHALDMGSVLWSSLSVRSLLDTKLWCPGDDKTTQYLQQNSSTSATLSVHRQGAQVFWCWTEERD
jgi:hypothetical protein